MPDNWRLSKGAGTVEAHATLRRGGCKRLLRKEGDFGVGGMKFASDNWAGAAVPIAAAIAAEAVGHAPAYGGDLLTREVKETFSRLFEREVAVFFVATGTAANALALSAFARPAGLILCHADAHMNTDEGGAVEFLAGLKLIGLHGAAGKIQPDALADAIARFPPNAARYGQLAAISLSELAEFGTAYNIAEITALSEIAKDAGLAVHMDGARFGNAVAGFGSAPAALTWKAGVDGLSFGGTKGGCWQAEAVVFFDPAKAAEFRYFRKRAGHLISKSRFVAAQFKAFLEGDLWLDLAAHSNRMARLLSEGIAASDGRTAWPIDGNEVFAILPRPALARAKEAGASFHEWPVDGLPEADRPGGDEALVRLVMSFARVEGEVEQLLTQFRQC